MRVLITGGTGFVGSDTAAAVARAGHDVRLLVRRPDRVGPALAPFGIEVPGTVTGDVLDAGSVRAAAEGCDAIINAAAVYSLDPPCLQPSGRHERRGGRQILRRTPADGGGAHSLRLHRRAGARPPLPPIRRDTRALPAPLPTTHPPPTSGVLASGEPLELDG